METIIDLIIATSFTSFFIGAIDAFYDLKKAKGFVALALSAGVFYLIGYLPYDLIIMAPAGAFLSLAVMMLLEKPVSVTTRRL
jgi:hypothetical protein